MAFTRAIAAVLATALLLAAVGGGVGYALGRYTPGYYRSVFHGGHDPRFDPISMGVGQGLTQGTAGGVVVGLALVALLCWRDVCLSRAAEGAQTAPSCGSTAGRALAIVSGLLLVIVCSVAALLLGAVGGERGAYHRRYLEEREVLAPVLASNPAFSGVELNERSRGGVDLVGEVGSPDDMERLRDAVTRAVGEARAKEMLLGMRVGQ
jgi:hypothetical protein